MDRFELTRRLMTNAEACGIIIVAVDAFAKEGDEQKAREAGCDGYVTKPIDAQALRAAVARRPPTAE